MAQEKNNEKGIASLVLGLVSIILGWIPLLGLASGILAIIFYSQQEKVYSNDLATAGFVTGIIGLAFSVIYNIIWLFLSTMIIHL